MSKYDSLTLIENWIALAFLEQNNSVNANLQDKIKFHVEKGILTDSEVAPLVHKTTEAFLAIDKETIEIEKAMDRKIRKITGIRHLSSSTIKFNQELTDLINLRMKEKASRSKAEDRKLKLT